MDNLPALIEEARAIINNYSLGRKCSTCGKSIVNKGKLGLCQPCSHGPRAYSDGRICEGCDNPISNWNVSGYCQECRKKVVMADTSQRRASYRSMRQENKRKQRTEKKGKCHRCKRVFQLEDWQHSKMHWCLECRNSAAYQEYSDSQSSGSLDLHLEGW